MRVSVSASAHIMTIHDLVTKAVVAVQKNSKPIGIVDLDLSPDGKHVVTADSDKAVRLWRLPARAWRRAAASGL
jgi:WD40 repeat protein